MIVCHCHAVSDRTIRAAILAGARDTAEVGRRCGAGTRCGGCHAEIERLVATHATPAPQATSAVA